MGEKFGWNGKTYRSPKSEQKKNRGSSIMGGRGTSGQLGGVAGTKKGGIQQEYNARCASGWFGGIGGRVR